MYSSMKNLKKLFQEYSDNVSRDDDGFCSDNIKRFTELSIKFFTIISTILKGFI